MPSVGSYGNVGSSVEIKGVNTNTSIINLSITAPDVGVEKSIVFPANTKEFILKTRGKGRIQYSYTLGGSGTTFMSLGGNEVYNNTNFYESLTLYLQVDRVDIVEIEIHT